MVAAWAVEEDLDACRPRSVSDFCVRYELVPRKPSEEEKPLKGQVTPHAYPAYKEEDPQFGSPTASPFRERQEHHFGSPLGSPVAYQDLDIPQTPQWRDRANSRDGEAFGQAALQANDWSSAPYPYQGYPVMWVPVSNQQEEEQSCEQGQQVAPMLYYCVGFVNPEMQPEMPEMQPAEFAAGWQESPESSQWAPEPSQPSRSRKRQQTPPKVLQAGQVHRDAKGSEAAVVKDEERTTIMLRNIPKDTTRESMMELLNALGYAKKYDFLYLPRDFKDNFSIYGYAFVNFTDHHHANKALELLNGFLDWRSAEPNILPCEAHWGHPLQGYDAHVERYRNSPVMSSQVPDMCRPIVLQDGLPVSFPAPTKPIRLPRRKGWILTGRRTEHARS